ncbi:deoxyribonuclease V [Wenzhouxiangella sp. XN201]|uniref:deoxyribonuclease V n=1 Tax=Wenzhouxiangella sp. XN201 TaxID=2710755 RepID=UPI0013C9FC71|nr:deoxyribonuclease V [Wenzhouxiangella sp. XN201]NEZ02851.1 deoxyribonuclease V [Wenzhouxiangella sp. XN201]
MTDRSDARQLIALQRRLAQSVIEQDDLSRPVQLIAGVDAAFPDRGGTTRAAAVLMRYPDLEVIDQAVAQRPTSLPYIPGLLSFRELPAVLDAIEALSQTPDLVLCDGQGRAHPRRFGIACHLGVETGLATIGVGKSRLCGQHKEPGIAKGSAVDLVDGDDIIGRVIRSRHNVRPIFVSIGHRVDLDAAVNWTLACTTRYRLPEPIRRADRLAGQR